MSLVQKGSTLNPTRKITFFFFKGFSTFPQDTEPQSLFSAFKGRRIFFRPLWLHHIHPNTQSYTNFSVEIPDRPLHESDSSPNKKLNCPKHSPPECFRLLSQDLQTFHFSRNLFFQCESLQDAARCRTKPGPPSESMNVNVCVLFFCVSKKKSF